MTGVYPVPTTRTSDLLGQVRLLSQLHQDQIDILRYQSQISTGRRLLVPSDDAPAALRGMALQRLLELKAQAKVNLNTTQSYLDAADSSINGVSTLLNEVKAIALGVMTTTTTETARAAAAEQVRRTIEQLANVGNQNFRGRYLFAGARTTQLPFEMVEKHVLYQGNEGDLFSFADIDLPYASNVPGSEVFGTFSPGVRGTVDLNPVLTRQTPLSELRGGTGVTQGSIAISDGTTTSIIDISAAATVGDVADLIAANPPAGRTVVARVSATGLIVDIDDAGGGNLTVREVGGGTTAAELGILSPLGTGTNEIVGADLNPRLRLTTPIGSILGSRAIAFLDSGGANNNLVVEARQPGVALNGVAVQYVDDGMLHASPGLVPGSETAAFSTTAVAARAALSLSGFGNNLLLTGGAVGTGVNNVRIEIVAAGAIGNAATANYNGATRTLTLGVDAANATQTQTLVNAINAEGTFTAAYDPSDPIDGGYNPAAAVQATDAGVVRGNTGNSGGNANTVFVFVDPGGTTANQALAALQADATIDGLFETRLEGTDTTSDLAAGNGPIDVGVSAATEGGSGEALDLASGIQIQTGGITYTIDLSMSQTVEDLLNTLNGSPANVVAEIDSAGERITIRTRLSGADFSIGENGGTTASQLGVRSLTADTTLAELNYGRGIHTATGSDFTIRRKDGVALDIDVDGAQTLGDVLDLINGHPANLDPATNVVAQLARFGNGIELIDDNTAVGALEVERAFLSEAAYDLGLVPRGGTLATATPAVSPTAGLAFPPPNDLNTAMQLAATTAGTAFNGVEIVFQDTLVGNVASVSYNGGLNRLTVSLDSAATTANTVLTAINADGTFTAALDTAIDPTNDGTGIVGTVGTVGTAAGGEPAQFQGTDPNPQEVAGVFNSLIRLHEAIANFSLAGIQRAVARMDEDFQRVNFARAEIGARGRSLESLNDRIEDEQIQLKSTLSNEIDTDLTDAISKLTAQQAILEATLRLTAQTFQLSLLDFL
ncbi:MAG: flagellin [Pirellulaceae bacterium]